MLLARRVLVEVLVVSDDGDEHYILRPINPEANQPK
jgi:hypothetical protein